MSGHVDSESKVSGNQANVPAHIRQELDIDDGDKLRWRIEDDGTLRVEVVQQEEGTFEGFDGYDGSRQTDAASEHDAWGVDESLRHSSASQTQSDDVDENLRFSSANQNAKRSGDVDGQ